MNVKECIKAAMSENGYTQKAIAEKVGKNQSDIAMYLSRADTMRLENLMLIMNACDYDIAFVNRRDRNKMYIIGEGKTDVTEEKSYAVPEQDHTEVERAIHYWWSDGFSRNEPFGKHQGSSDTLEDLIRRVVQEELAKR